MRKQELVVHLDVDHSKLSFEVEQVLLELFAMLDQHVALQSWRDEAGWVLPLASWLPEVASLQVESPWELPLGILGQPHPAGALLRVEASAQVGAFAFAWHQDEDQVAWDLRAWEQLPFVVGHWVVLEEEACFQRY